MKLTKSTWQEKLEINQCVDPHRSQDIFLSAFLFQTWSTLVHAKK